jgi:hypothetical protein
MSRTGFVLFWMAGLPLLHFGQPQFINPLLLTPSLSGTFAEIRSDHFHSGIDLRTNEMEGLPVLAAADGFISRIKVSASGFGNVLYMDHPSGYTTVYAHLHRFSEELERQVVRQQYLKKSFEVEWFPSAGSLSVQQGQLIGFSGNTGSSSGPHLHFEIRDSRTSMPLNPLPFLMRLTDTVAPVIRNILLIDYVPCEDGYYPVSRTLLSVNDPEGNSVSLNDTLPYHFTAGLGVEAYDSMQGSSALLGVKQVVLKTNGRETFRFEVEKFSFHETRYVNACIDYSLRVSEGKTFLLLHRLPGNHFSAFTGYENQGYIETVAGRVTACEIIVSDFFGNVASARFRIQKSMEKKPVALPSENKIISPVRHPVIHDRWVRVEFPQGLMTYNIHEFDWQVMDSAMARYSVFARIGRETIPVHQPYTLKMKVRHLPSEHREKSLIVFVNEKQKRQSMGGQYAEGWVSASVRTFGYFYVEIDTLGPIISTPQITDDELWQGRKITFRISDNLSGIGYYEMQIDRQWVPARYDEKTGTLFYILAFSETVAEKDIYVKTLDKKKNQSVWNGRIRF